MTRTTLLAAVSALAATLVAPAHADLVKLRSGSTIDGKILKQTDRAVWVDIGADVLQIDMEQVDSIDRAGAGAALKADASQMFSTAKDLPTLPPKELAKGLGPAVIKVSTPGGLGSGVIISPEGFAITNAHVIQGERSLRATIWVRQPDGSLKRTDIDDVEIEAVNNALDLALIKLKSPDGKPFPVAPVEAEDAIEAGQRVFAIGNPLGLERTLTEGVVSVPAMQLDGRTYIQTDTPINPGNSGGPLVDLDGRVVGINTAIESRSGGSDGIGFAIPANMAKGVVESIMGGSSPSRGFLGIQMQPVDPALAANFGFQGQGVLVNQVVAGGAAERAGIEVGDILVKVNGQPTPSLQKVQRAVKLCAPGAECPIEVFRDGETVSLVATLDDASKALAGATPVRVPSRTPAVPQAPSAVAPASVGIEVAAITPAMAKERNITDLRGVVVTSVAEGSAAERAGLRAGDVIRQVSGTRIAGTDDWDKNMRSTMGPGRSVRLLVEREGNAKFLLLRA